MRRMPPSPVPCLLRQLSRIAGAVMLGGSVLSAAIPPPSPPPQGTEQHEGGGEVLPGG